MTDRHAIRDAMTYAPYKWEAEPDSVIGLLRSIRDELRLLREAKPDSYDSHPAVQAEMEEAARLTDDRPRRIADAIVNDILDRRGLKQEWRRIDPDVQKDIVASWIAIIRGII